VRLELGWTQEECDKADSVDTQQTESDGKTDVADPDRVGDRQELK
ncbi:hypothetical protein LCGC14_2468480, partial [marine sediment metagenome]